MNFISNIIVSIALSIASLFGYHSPQILVGTTAGIVQGTTFYLSGAGVTATQNTIPLTSFITPDGRNLVIGMFQGGTIYGAIEAGTSKLEDFTATGITQNANGSATLTGVTRGNDFIAPYAASTTLAKAHAGGSALILSNTAGFYGNQFIFANSISSSTAGIVFSSTTPPYYDSPGVQSNGTYISTTSELASIAYVNTVAASGCANATTGVKGCIQIATGLQAASSTGTGGTGALLVIPSSLATDTPNSLTRTSRSLFSDLTGYLKQGWIDLTQSFTFSGGLTSSGTTTISGIQGSGLKLNTVATYWPSSTGAASTTLVNDGSGNIYYLPYDPTIIKDSVAYSTSNTATTTLKTYTIAANTIGPNGMLRFTVYITGSGANNNKCIEVNFGTGTASTTLGYVCATAQGAAFQGGMLTGSIRNINSLSSQITGSIGSGQNLATQIASSTVPLVISFGTTATYNMGATTYLNIRGAAANGSDTVTAEGMTVERIP